jgi:preprotein translocase subunit SecB
MLELECGLRNTQPVDGEFTIVSDLGVGWNRQPEGTIAYAVRVNVRLVATAHNDHLVFECNTACELVYAVSDPQNYEDREFLAFGMTTAVFASWPYLREIVQNSSIRCGLQPIILEVLRQPVFEGSLEET